MAYISKEISLVCFDLNVFITWGKKEVVVHVAAVKPIRVIKSNFILPHEKLNGLYIFF